MASAPSPRVEGQTTKRETRASAYHRFCDGELLSEKRPIKGAFQFLKYYFINNSHFIHQSLCIKYPYLRKINRRLPIAHDANREIITSFSFSAGQSNTPKRALIKPADNNDRT